MMEQEDALRESVSLCSELLSTLQNTLLDLPRGSLPFMHVDTLPASLLRHLTHVIKLVQPLVIPPPPHDQLQNLLPPSLSPSPLNPQYASDTTDTSATAHYSKPALLPTNSKHNIDTASGRTARRQERITSKHTVRLAAPDVLSDGFIWRKYGEKPINHSPHKRSYYRCRYKASHGCPAQKRVQKTEDEVVPAEYAVTYINEHTCGSGRSGQSQLHTMSRIKNEHPEDNNYFDYSLENYGISTRVDSNQSNAASCASDLKFSPSLYINHAHDQSNLQSFYDMTSNISTYYASLYDNATIINSPPALTSPSMHYAEQMQASCSDFDAIKSPNASAQVLSNSPSSSLDPIIIHQPLYYALPQQEYIHDMNSHDTLIGSSSLSTAPYLQLSNSASSNLNIY